MRKEKKKNFSKLKTIMFPMNEERKTRWTPQKKKKTELELQNFI